MAESVEDDNASKVTIFDLNFDCLSKIFNSLELDNLLDLRKVCDFFDDVVVKYFRRSKIIKIDDKFIVKYSKYMREYLSIISESVEDLVFKIESEYEPDKITNFIEDLVFDQVHTLEVDDPFTEQLMPITNFPNVVTLRVYGPDIILTDLCKLQKLKHFLHTTSKNFPTRKRRKLCH
ncbi:uncharacterized protein ACN427_006887 isoform 1-T1 [Glossina fuscipes fuscipes]